LSASPPQARCRSSSDLIFGAEVIIIVVVLQVILLVVGDAIIFFVRHPLVIVEFIILFLIGVLILVLIILILVIDFVIDIVLSGRPSASGLLLGGRGGTGRLELESQPRTALHQAPLGKAVVCLERLQAGLEDTSRAARQVGHQTAGPRASSHHA
jgi:hypothetical protein